MSINILNNKDENKQASFRVLMPVLQGDTLFRMNPEPAEWEIRTCLHAVVPIRHRSETLEGGRYGTQAWESKKHARRYFARDLCTKSEIATTRF